jgi:hypothetical protein
MTVAEEYKNSVRYWEIASFIFIILTGSLMHFAYSSTGSLLLSPIAPVNESVWEHLKLAVWPASIFGLFEFFFVRHSLRRAGNFLVARTAQVVIMPSIIVAVFYFYTSFTGDSILAVDILTFVFAALIGQLSSYTLLQDGSFPRSVTVPAITILAIVLSLLVLFTYIPPHKGIFMDENTGEYGLPQN